MKEKEGKGEEEKFMLFISCLILKRLEVTRNHVC